MIESAVGCYRSAHVGAHALDGCNGIGADVLGSASASLPDMGLGNPPACACDFSKNCAQADRRSPSGVARRTNARVCDHG